MVSRASRPDDAVSPIAGTRQMSLTHGPWRAGAHTRPAFYDPAELLPNVDSVMLAPARVGNDPAVVVALAHGNYKDHACAFASDAAMVAAHAQLARDFLAEADVGPALQRAFHSADARIREIAEGPLPDVRTGFPRFWQPNALLSTVMGVRKSMSGIGASMIAAVITTRHAFVAHAGECRAFLVGHDSTPRLLTQAHTLAATAEGRAAIAEDPSRRALFEDVVARVLGFGDVQVELTRAPLSSGDRLVLGNPALRHIRDFSGSPADAVLRVANELTAHEHGRYLPATLAIIGGDDDAR